MSKTLTIDARGLVCPQPVLETKKVLDDGKIDQFVVIVDTVSARENVSRLAMNQGCRIDVKNEGDAYFEIGIRRTAEPSALEEEPVRWSAPLSSTGSKNLIYVATNCMGKGDDELGERLMRGFLRTLIDINPKPWRMVFINSGIKLTTVDEDAVEALSILQERGTEMLTCGTCLQHFGLEENLRVGRVTNMFEVLDSFNTASKVISPD